MICAKVSGLTEPFVPIWMTTTDPSWPNARMPSTSAAMSVP